MKAYLIDPFNRQVSEVDYNGDFREISKFIQCDYFTAATFNKNGDSFFVDDEGLFKEDKMFFEHHGYPQPLAGYGLVLGTDPDGESTAPKISLEDLASDIMWYSEFTVGLSGTMN
jgi:hypothetical protein